jgi:transposase
MHSWVRKLTDHSIDARYVMEATGVYHESFAYFLDGEREQLSIVLPNKISNYFRTLDVKTITDKTSAEAIAMFGLEKNLNRWQAPDPTYMVLRQLTRERDQLLQERTVVSNQLHAEESCAHPSPKTVARKKSHIAFINKQVAEITKEINELIKTNEQIKEAVKLITSIVGIGTLTAATILGETNGFDLIRNKKQLTSYAGLDIKEKQSGTSVKGRPKISKRGNRHLRKALYMPSMTAIQHDERFKAIYARLIAKHGVKMKALVAIQRKLLEISYILFKNEEVYDREYLQKQIAAELEEA